jgi:thymidine kinase
MTGITEEENAYFMKSLGFPQIKVHHALNHFDFAKAERRILVIGPMGSGKTEFSARMWRDSRVAKSKTGAARAQSTTEGADRRELFFVRSNLDSSRFPDYPVDALAYRGGFERCGERIAQARDSFALERLIAENPEVGTWIVDEAAFYDERIAYVTRNESKRRGLVFVFPSLILNFRNEIFNATARLLVDTATDVFPLTAYCEHRECLEDSFYTYRYYLIDGVECPALYFDPLIIIGGDRRKDDPKEPNYCTRCDAHHYLPGKEYTFFFLKPAGELASRGRDETLLGELRLLARDIERSELRRFVAGERRGEASDEAFLRSLLVPCIAEKALIFLYAEQNLLSSEQVKRYARELGLDIDYLERRLSDNRRPVDFGSQGVLFPS